MTSSRGLSPLLLTPFPPFLSSSLPSSLPFSFLSSLLPFPILSSFPSSLPFFLSSPSFLSSLFPLSSLLPPSPLLSHHPIRPLAFQSNCLYKRSTLQRSVHTVHLWATWTEHAARYCNSLTPLLLLQQLLCRKPSHLLLRPLTGDCICRKCPWNDTLPRSVLSQVETKAGLLYVCLFSFFYVGILFTCFTCLITDLLIFNSVCFLFIYYSTY